MTDRASLIDSIRQLPALVTTLIDGLTKAQLVAHPLAGEWSVAQNVHHLADSHINSYIRCKLIATEENPTLKPYDQELWAEMADAKEPDVGASLALLTALHSRWVVFWGNLPMDAWHRTGHHSESGKVSLDDQLRLYAAHGGAHLDQIARTLAAGREA